MDPIEDLIRTMEIEIDVAKQDRNDLHTKIKSFDTKIEVLIDIKMRLKEILNVRNSD